MWQNLIVIALVILAILYCLYHFLIQKKDCGCGHCGIKSKTRTRKKTR